MVAMSHLPPGLLAIALILLGCGMVYQVFRGASYNRLGLAAVAFWFFIVAILGVMMQYQWKPSWQDYIFKYGNSAFLIWLAFGIWYSYRNGSEARKAKFKQALVTAVIVLIFFMLFLLGMRIWLLRGQ